MRVHLSATLLASLGLTLKEKYADGYANPGEVIQSNGAEYLLTREMLSSYTLADRTLELISGAQIDFLHAANSLRYVILRRKTQNASGGLTGIDIRLVEGLSGGLLPYQYVPEFQQPNYGALTQAYQNKQSLCGYDFYCSTALYEQYNQLYTSAQNYTVAAQNLEAQQHAFLLDPDLTTSDVSTLLTFSQDFQFKAADYYAKWSAFAEDLAPWPIPQEALPPDTRTPLPIPQTPIPQSPIPQAPISRIPAPGTGNSDND